jgi:hypothetical protein
LSEHIGIEQVPLDRIENERVGQRRLTAPTVFAANFRGARRCQNSMPRA